MATFRTCVVWCLLAKYMYSAINQQQLYYAFKFAALFHFMYGKIEYTNTRRLQVDEIENNPEALDIIEPKRYIVVAVCL